MKALALLPLALAFLMACAPATRSAYPLSRVDNPTTIPDWPHGRMHVTALGHRVWIPESLEPAAIDILGGVDFTCLEFERREGVHVPLLNVGIQDHIGWRFDQQAFGDRDPVYDWNLAGCWCGINTVMVSYQCRKLYHELVHAIYLLWEHVPQDRWDEWNRITAEVGAAGGM